MSDEFVKASGYKLQNNWAFCANCFCLYYTGFADFGACASKKAPSNGGHVSNSSFNYLLMGDAKAGITANEGA